MNWQQLEDDERYDIMYRGGPEFIVCDASVYEEFRRAIGEAIWEGEFERARLRLRRLDA
jgi:hypothetical protein